MKPAVRRRIGVISGMVLGTAAVVWLSAPGCEYLHAPGPMNTGHAGVACEACHRAAPGSLRQQLGNAARHSIGLRAAAVDIGYRDVTTDECLACHVRPDDRHPGFRFLEPRFTEVRDLLHPERCESCHLEHGGVRVTVAELTYCRHCHADTVLDDDPLDVSHRELVEASRWESCLGCHDYHGNHAMKAPRRLEDAIPVEQLRTYFDGGRSPYPPPVLRAVTPEVQSP